MSPTVPKQHPAVVLRSQFVHLRSLLAIAMIAIVAMAVAIVVLASAGTSTPGTSTPQSSSAPAPSGATRYDGGPEEGSRGALASPRVPTTRYDGGPVEGAAVRATGGSQK